MVCSDFQQSAQPQYMQAPSMQYAVQFRGQSSGAVQQLPGCYTIPPQQIPHQLPPTGFTGQSQGIVAVITCWCGSNDATLSLTS